MDAAGMVDALAQILLLLAPGGRLIDIHPHGEPPPLRVRLGESVRLMGWVREEGNYESYHQADAALSTALRRQWYRLAAQETFAFITYFDTLADLRAYLAAEWSQAYLEDLVAMQIEATLQSPSAEREIILEEIVRISLLQPQ